MTGPKLHRLGPALATLALAWLAACAGGSAGTEPSRTGPDAGAAPPHALEAERLRQTMRELEAVRRLRLPQEFDPGRERALRREEAARSARAIAAAAERIGLAPPADLSPEDREGFRRLAEALRSHAASLAAGAEGLDPSELERRFAEIDATCDACHGRFHRGPVPLRAPGP